MLAAFSIVPVGVGEELKEHVARLIALIDRSGLPYKLGAMQTTVEGDEQAVMNLIMDCHRLARQHASRVLTHIAIDDRDGAAGRLDGKVNDVRTLLKKDLPHD